MATINRQLYRPSSLPLLLKCGESAAGDQVVAIGGPADGSDRLGNAIHRALSRSISAGQVDDVEIDLAAARFAVNVADVRPLVLAGWKLWQRVAELFPGDLVIEQRIKTPASFPFAIDGTPDLVAYVDDQARILDWKTGYLDLDASEQLRAYGWLTLQDDPMMDSVWAGKLRVRDGDLEPYQWTRAELDDWYAGLTDRVAEIGNGRYRPGEHCRRCPRLLECHARKAALYEAIGVVQAVAGSNLLPAVKNQQDIVGQGFACARVLEFVQMVEDCCKRARALIRTKVAEHGGRLPAGADPTGDGNLELRFHLETQEPIHYSAKAEAIIKEHLPRALWADVFAIGKTALKQAVYANADGGERGAKKRAWESLEVALREAGAVGVKTVEKLELGRVPVAVKGE